MEIPPAIARPIKRLPVRTRKEKLGKDVPVEITGMTQDHVEQWMWEVQPLIDSHYERATPGAALDNIRADVGWNWRKIVSYAGLQTWAARAPGFASGPALAWCIAVRDNSGDAFPIGMLTVVPSFHCSIQGSTAHRVFTWYLADAPSEAYDRYFGGVMVTGVARALIDTAIQCGAVPQGARDLVLHADPAGGDKLLGFYDKCGMQRIDEGASRISLWRGAKDGRYFWMTGQQAQAFSQSNDTRR